MKVCVTAFPYAVMCGEIEISDDVKDICEYLKENWDDIEFDEPDLDCAGTDFDYEIEDEEEEE